MAAHLFNKQSTRAEAMRARLDLEIRAVMVGVASDPVTLLEVVCGGEHLWRQRFGRAFRGLVPGSVSTDGIADSIFAFFCRKVGETFREFAFGTAPGVIFECH